MKFPIFLALAYEACEKRVWALFAEWDKESAEFEEMIKRFWDQMRADNDPDIVLPLEVIFSPMTFLILTSCSCLIV